MKIIIFTRCLSVHYKKVNLIWPSPADLVVSLLFAPEKGTALAFQIPDLIDFACRSIVAVRSSILV